MVCGASGHVIDPANDLDRLADVAVKDGRILRVAPPGVLKAVDARKTFDAAGLLVVPGLIDTHVHVYQDETPLGIDADKYCLARGSTTVVDLGSAGAENMQGMAETARKTKTRVLAFCHVSAFGLAPTGPGNNQGAAPRPRMPTGPRPDGKSGTAVRYYNTADT